MIVNCPKCEFEQPIDEYCAQCGAPLRKLVEAERLKRQNSSNLPIYLSAFAFFILAGVGLSIVFNKEPPSAQSTNLEKPNVVVSLKSAKIKADRDNSYSGADNDQNLEVSAKSAGASPKSYPTLKNQGLDTSQEQPAAKAVEAATSTFEPLKEVIFQKLEVISDKNCELEIASGPLNKTTLSQLKSCASVISTKSFSSSGEILKEGKSFETILNWELQNNSFQISASFSSESIETSQSENTSLNLTEDTVGYLISSSFADLIDKENLEEDALNNNFNTYLFNFNSNEANIYFLLLE